MRLHITGVLETALYAEDIVATAAFYEGILGLAAMFRGPRLVAFEAGPASVLLIFQKGETSADIVSAGGIVPGHDGAGRLQIALAIASEDLGAWRQRLADHGVPLIGEQKWPAGGVSLYFNDPDRHVVELATPGLWPNY
jgi:catechol 2,3-dioxygenase-like lactoylglutathione lyase family enzyme